MSQCWENLENTFNNYDYNLPGRHFKLHRGKKNVNLKIERSNIVTLSSAAFDSKEQSFQNLADICGWSWCKTLGTVTICLLIVPILVT